jgi:SAM-dependent methyltransferase
MHKFDLQENLYQFPYHHIPQRDKKGRLSIIRSLPWGHEYSCYQLHLKNKIEFLNPMSVLEVGCGDGHLIMSLDKSIVRRVGIDLSLKSINMAKAFNESAVEFICTDARKISEEFDVVVSPEVLEHIPDEEVSDFIRLLESRTKIGGKVLISVPTTNLMLHHKHYRHYTIDLFKKQLADSGSTMTIDGYEYIYFNSLFMKFFITFSHNNRWNIEFACLRKPIWNYVWNKLRIANENNGHRLIVLLSKPCN